MNMLGKYQLNDFVFNSKYWGKCSSWIIRSFHFVSYFSAPIYANALKLFQSYTSNPLHYENCSLTDEIESLDKAMTAEENDIDCLFELCKEDFPFLSSEQQTINIGKFLQVSQIWKYQKIVRDDYFEKEISVENNDIHFASDTRNTDENNKDYYISISGLFDNK